MEGTGSILRYTKTSQERLRNSYLEKITVRNLLKRMLLQHQPKKFTLGCEMKFGTRAAVRSGKLASPQRDQAKQNLFLFEIYLQ